MSDDWAYVRIGGALGIIPAFLTFVGSWWYCAATYGFLLGFGLGWLPALLLAGLVELAFMFLWGPALAGVVLFVALPALNQESSPDKSADNSAFSDELVEATSIPAEAPSTEDGPWNDFAPDAFPDDLTQLSDEELLQLEAEYSKPQS